MGTENIKFKHDDADNASSAMQWFILYLLAVWIIGAMSLTAIVFCFTRNPLSLSLFANITPPSIVLYRITKHLFQLGYNDTKVAIAKQRVKRRASSLD